MKTEKELLLLSIIQDRTSDEQRRLEELLSMKNDWAYISGQIVHHRLLGYVYYGLGDEFRRHIDKELRTMMEMNVRLYKKIYNERYNCIEPILKDFEDSKIRYAGIKGIIYPLINYPIGIRYSGDFDILLCESDYSMCDEILKKHNFIESNDKGYNEASKKEKLIQRMNYHDLVPYFCRKDYLYQDYIKIDINIHFDGKENDVTSSIIEEGTNLYNRDNMVIRGLKIETHFLHMCTHFFREATSTLWTTKRYDVTLYKLVDILNTYRYMKKEEVYRCIELSKKFNCFKQMYYSIYYLNQFFHDVEFEKILDRFAISDTSFLLEIKEDGKNSIIIRNEDLYDKTFNLVY